MGLLAREARSYLLLASLPAPSLPVCREGRLADGRLTGLPSHGATRLRRSASKSSLFANVITIGVADSRNRALNCETAPRLRASSYKRRHVAANGAH